MISAVWDRQLMIRTKNKVGTLAEITNIISSNNINLVAICAYAIEDTAALMLVAEDNNAAKSLLESHQYKVQEEEVILLTVHNRPGALQAFIDKIAQAGIDLALIYGSVENSAEASRIVLISKNNLELMLLIKTEIERMS